MSKDNQSAASSISPMPSPYGLASDKPNAVDHRQIVAYIRRDDISWWAGCRYEQRRLNERRYIRETSCLTRWGAKVAARRMARRARRLRVNGRLGEGEVRV